MAEFRRSDDGIWSVHLDETDKQDRNEMHDEAVPRYLTALRTPRRIASARSRTRGRKALLQAAALDADPTLTGLNGEVERLVDDAVDRELAVLVEARVRQRLNGAAPVQTTPESGREALACA